MVKTPLPATSGQDEPARAPRPLRIIVADDDRDSVLTLMMVLRHEGHEVRGVYRGSDVLRALEDFEPDAALVDIHMPDINGYDVARSLRSTRAGEKMLLIGITGVYKKGVDAMLAKLAGFDYYLTKPYEPSDVLRLIAPLRLPRPDA